MTDKEIIEQLQNNQYSRAINGLYNILPQVKQYIRNNSGSAEDAQDMFQDALVILYKKIHAGNFILSVPLKTYLLAVVKHCWLAELRKRKKIPVTDATFDITDIKIDEEPGFTIASSAFHFLGEKCKQLLILFYFQKKSFKEIARALAFSSEMVAKNQKYRCIQKAKENYVTLSSNDIHE
jgi:RNA polymerase sigma factor (sigma-70 family)